MADQIYDTLKQINEAVTDFKSEHNDRLTQLEIRAARPAFATTSNDGIDAESKSAFIGMLQGKAMNGQAGPDGGFLVPAPIDLSVGGLITKLSPLRQVANVVNLTSPNTTFPVNLRGVGSGWVGEGDDRPITVPPKIAQVTLPGGTVYALPTVTEELVDDAVVDIESFLRNNVADEMAMRESEAFLTGDGNKKPKGILAETMTNQPDATRAFGSIQYIPTGAASNLGDIHANLTKLIYSMKAGYRQADGCAWLMSTDLLATIGAMKDASGRPLYYPAMSDTQPGTLLGYRVIECEHLAGVAAGNVPIIFGNFLRGYTIADRTALSVLRDPYSLKGAVAWYFRKRVHGAVVNSEAIKVLKVAAS